MRLTLATISAVTLVSAAMAQEPAPTGPADGKIVIYRPSAIIGAGAACPVRYHGVEIVELGRGKFAEWMVPAGTYILGNRTTSVEVNVAPGATRFVRCQIKMGFMSGGAELQIVDREAFEEHSASFERKVITASPSGQAQ